jgi:hypothetical protein
MKTIINGVEITPRMADMLQSRYEKYTCIEETFPYVFVDRISGIRDYLTDIRLEKEDGDRDVPKLKYFPEGLMLLKEHMKELIPEYSDKRQIKY